MPKAPVPDIDSVGPVGSEERIITVDENNENIQRRVLNDVLGDVNVVSTTQGSSSLETGNSRGTLVATTNILPTAANADLEDNIRWTIDSRFSLNTRLDKLQEPLTRLDPAQIGWWFVSLVNDVEIQENFVELDAWREPDPETILLFQTSHLNPRAKRISIRQQRNGDWYFENNVNGLPSNSVIKLYMAVARGKGVPAGGTVGQVLTKIDSIDYNTEWTNQTGGGGGGLTEQQVENKINATIPSNERIPSGGTAGQVLKKYADADHNVSWQDDFGLTQTEVDARISNQVPSASRVPTTGTTGQILTKTSSGSEFQNNPGRTESQVNSQIDTRIPTNQRVPQDGRAGEVLSWGAGGIGWAPSVLAADSVTLASLSSDVENLISAQNPLFAFWNGLVNPITTAPVWRTNQDHRKYDSTNKVWPIIGAVAGTNINDRNNQIFQDNAQIGWDAAFAFRWVMDFTHVPNAPNPNGSVQVFWGSNAFSGNALVVG